MGELKPCPFCGGEAEIAIKEGVLKRRIWYVRCKKCSAMADGYYEPNELEDYHNPYAEITKTVENAVALWNRRANDGEEAQKAAE